MKRILPLLLSLAAPCAFALPRPAGASYARGAQLTVAGYDAAKPALADFPVLVRIAENAPSGFSYADLHSPTNGDDLAFVDLGGNGLPFEIDTWNTNGTSLAWVALPAMTNGAQFVMCWGSDTSGRAVCADNPWGAYLNVWHMNGTNVVDSAAAGYDGTAGGTVALDAAAPVGSGMIFPGNTSSYVSFGSKPNADLANGTTIECWIKNASGNGCIFQKKDFVQYRYTGGKLRFTTRGVKDVDMSAPPANGTWYHAVVTFAPNGGSSALVLYINGSRVWSTTTSDYKASEKTKSADMKLGITEWSSDPFNGSLDEFRLSSSPLSADWIAATYATQSDPAFLAAGAAESYEATAEPQVGLSAPSSAVGYTNATLAVSVGSLGMDAAMTADADWIDATLLVATEGSFADPILSLPLARTNEAPVSFPVAVGPLATNTTYFARVLATNSFAVAGASAVASFTTLAPGAPAVAAQAGAAGFSGFSVTAVPTEIGTGGEKVTLWLDVSAAGDFSDTVSFGGVETNAVPAAVPLSATGLANGTNYAARVRAVNVWGVAATSATLSMATRTEPVEMSAPTALYAGEGVETLGIAAVDLEPGAAYSVSLSVDGATMRTWTGLTSIQPFSADWTGREGTTHAAVFTVSSSLDGRSWTREYRTSFTMGSTVTPISDVSDLDSMVLRVGDAVSLPALGPGQSLAYDTNAVVSLDGAVLTALEPGACRVRVFSTDAVSGEASLTGSGVAIVAPAVTDVKGGLFVNRTATSGTVKWRNAASWQKISGAEGHDWPDGTDDIALVYPPLVDKDVTFDLENHDIVLGHLGAGSTHEKQILYFTKGGITFQTSDGSESWLRFSGRTGGNGELSFASTTPITLANDLVLDGVGQDVMRAAFNGPIHIGDHTLRTARVPYYGGGDPYPRGQLQLIGDVSGTGLFLHEADTTMRANGTKSFTGTWDIRNGRHDGNYGGAGMFLGGCHLSGAAELAVRGAWMSDKSVRHGANVKTGWGNSYQYTASTNYFVKVLPPKVTLDGGRLSLTIEGPFPKTQVTNYLATGVRDDWYVTGELRIAGGPMGHINSGFVSNFNDYYPNAHTIVTNLVVEPGGSSSFTLATAKAFGTYPTATNEFRIVNGPAVAWDSGKDYEILPFLFRNAESNDRNVVVRDTATGLVTTVAPDSTASSTGNIRQLGANGRNDSMADGSTWEAVTVYPWAYAYFARTNSTVRILSGYLNVVKTQFAPTNHANSASSTVDFGDRTAYVYVNSQADTADIGCRVKGTGGFVKSAGGTLRLFRPMDALTGGVWVGCGRLALLGDATLGTNDVSVAAGAKLRVACDADPFWRDARLDLEDRAWIDTASRIELENGVENRVRRLYVSGENRRRGTWGSSESAAQFVDDRLFSGPGVLKVKGDDLLQPTLLILK